MLNDKCKQTHYNTFFNLKQALGLYLFVLLIGSIPILLWGIYFHGKNPRKEPFSQIAGIFLLGTLSIVPVLAFHQFLSGPFLARMEIAHPFLAQPFVIGALQLVLVPLFALLFILFFFSLNSAWLRLRYRLAWRQSFGAMVSRLYNLAPLLAFLLFFLAMEVVFGLSLGDSFVLSLAGSTMLFAMLEEYFKYIINPFLVYKKINSIGAAMVHALYVGLAFAFVENALFFYRSLLEPDFAFIFVYRSLFTALLHVCASGILGYFYGRSLFASSMVANYEIEKTAYSVPAWMRRAFGLGKNMAFRSTSITQGFVLAALVHSLFNLLLSLNMKALAGGMVLVLALGVLAVLRSGPAQVQYGLIGSQAMPEAEFEKLRLQISVIQHLKEIQEQRLASSKPQ